MMTKEERKTIISKRRTRFSLAGQVLIFSLLATILTAALSFVILWTKFNYSVSKERQDKAAELTDDVVMTIKAYPAYEWLITYWFQNSDKLDVEYELTDATREKATLLSERHPGLVIDYVATEQLETFSEEDKKLYAEIVYSQMVNLLNQLKEIYNPTYIAIILMEQSYSEGTFIMSGASRSQKRGTNYDEAYVIGVTAQATQKQKESILAAAAGGRSLAEADDYVDSYGYVQDIMDGRHIIVDVTYETAGLRNEIKSQVINGIFMFVLLQMVLAFALYILVYVYAVRPVEHIQKNVWSYREEKDSRKVLEDLSKIKIRNELGALSADISDMVVSIDNYVDEIQDITAEKEKISAELNVANKLQAEMLPSDFPAFPDRKEFDLYATMDPAKEVGGDFYDFFFVDDDHLCLVVADVSGKSIPAALFMVNSKTRIQNQASFGKSPGQILAAVNDQLCLRNESGFFVTVWIAIIDLKTGKGVAANAGHEHPVIRRANGSYELVIYRHSLAVGVVEGVPFNEHEFELHPGDRIFIYTDGVPEATSEQDELFGEERMVESLNSHMEDSLQELLPDLKKDIDKFVGNAPQFDDITMLGFDYYGPRNN